MNLWQGQCIIQVLFLKGCVDGKPETVSAMNNVWLMTCLRFIHKRGGFTNLLPIIHLAFYAIVTVRGQVF